MRYLCVLLLLAGCSQQPQRTIYDAAADECVAYGFKQGTEAYGNCMQREVADRRALGARILLGR